MEASITVNEELKVSEKIKKFLKYWGKEFGKFIVMDVISCLLISGIMLFSAAHLGWIAVLV